MTIIHRLSSLFKADVHAVLDKIEEPQLLLQQALRDMAQVVVTNEQELQRLTTAELVLATQQTENEQMRAALRGELDICLAAGKDDLARDLLRRDLAAARADTVLGRQLATVRRDATTLREKLATQQRELLDLKLRSEHAVHEPSARTHDLRHSAVRDEEIEIALLREKQARGLL